MTRASGACWKRLTKTRIVTTKLAATSAVAIQPEIGFPRRFPKSASTQKPTSGKTGNRNAAWIIERSALQHVRVIGGGAGLSTEYGNDDAESHDDLSGRDDENEEHRDLTTDVVQLSREGDERQIRCIQHQLYAHEHHQHVASDQQPNRPDREDHRGKREIPRRSDTHRASAWSASRRRASSMDSRAPISTSTISCPSWRRARTTAATTATINRAEVTSKGNR